MTRAPELWALARRPWVDSRRRRRDRAHVAVAACVRSPGEDDAPVTIIDNPDSGRRLRCALFVDFDNVYIGLQRLDPGAAEAFASAPAHWLTALETSNDADGEFSRRFLTEPAT